MEALWTVALRAASPMAYKPAQDLLVNLYDNMDDVRKPAPQGGKGAGEGGEEEGEAKKGAKEEVPRVVDIESIPQAWREVGTNLDILDIYDDKNDKKKTWKWRHGIVRRISPDTKTIEIQFSTWNENFNVKIDLTTQHLGGWKYGVHPRTGEQTVVRGPLVSEFGVWYVSPIH